MKDILVIAGSDCENSKLVPILFFIDEDKIWAELCGKPETRTPGLLNQAAKLFSAFEKTSVTVSIHRSSFRIEDKQFEILKSWILEQAREPLSIDQDYILRRKQRSVCVS